MCSTAKGLSPFSVGYSLGLLMNLGFICEQCTQDTLNLVTSIFIVGHQTIDSSISIKS